jgi:dihydroxyacid dehydratase/phosphogluconate dehydratase
VSTEKELNSTAVTKGPARAPHRSLLYAVGWDKGNMEKPLIGVANAFSELIPGHLHLRQVADKVKEGIWSAGGAAAEFGTIGVCDGLDGLVLVTNCDKIVPGMVMGAARIDIPAKRLDLLPSDEELAGRAAAFCPVVKQTGSLYLDSYSQNVSSAAQGPHQNHKTGR